MDINYAYVLILCCGLLATAVVPFQLLRRKTISVIAFDPVVLFSLYFGLIHFLTPLVKHVEGYYRYQYSYNGVTLVGAASITCLLYTMAVVLSGASKVTLRRGLKNKKIFYQKINSLEKVSIAIFAIGAIAALMDYNILVNTIGVETFLADRHMAAEERGSLRIFANFIIIGFSLYVAAISVNLKINKRKILVLVCMLIIAIAYYSFISSRNSLLLMTIFGASIYVSNKVHAEINSGIKLGSLKYLFFIGVVAIAAIYVLTVQRYSASESSYAQIRLDKIELYMLDGAFGNDEALLWMLENNHSLLLGKTYLAAFLNVVPRGIWAEKPLGGGPELINMIFPGSYVIGADKNNSLTTGLLTEAMMNFGIVGLPLIIIIWALTANYLLKKALSSRSLSIRTLYIMVSVSVSTSLIYSEFLGFIVRLGMYLLPIIIVGILMPKIGKKITYAI